MFFFALKLLLTIKSKDVQPGKKKKKVPEFKDA